MLKTLKLIAIVVNALSLVLNIYMSACSYFYPDEVAVKFNWWFAAMNIFFILINLDYSRPSKRQEAKG